MGTWSNSAISDYAQRCYQIEHTTSGTEIQCNLELLEIIYIYIFKASL